MIRFYVVLLVVVFSDVGFSLGDTVYPGMNDYLIKKGLSGKYSEKKYRKLSVLLNLGVKYLSINLKNNDDVSNLDKKERLQYCFASFPKLFCKHYYKSSRKDKKKYLFFLNKALDYLIKNTNSNISDKEFAVFQAKNLMYTVFAKQHKGRSLQITEVFSYPKKIQTSFPYCENKKCLNPLNINQTKREARFLIDPSLNFARSFLKDNDLEGKTSREIAELDVRDDHHIWHTKEYMKRHPNLWQDFRNMIKKIIEKRLQKKFKINNLTYSFDEAKKIVFFDKYKRGYGVHPKIKVKDAYGLSWKLKFGDEYYSEAVASYLYMMLGGKYQDINDAHTVENPILVVFPRGPDLGKSTDNKICGNIYNVSLLEKCIVKNSAKKIYLSRTYFPKNHGLITLENIDKIKKLVPKNIRLQYKDNDLLGRSFVIFHQISMELKDSKILKRSGPAPQGSVGNEDDRAMRGKTLFHLWIDDFDVKDGNSEGVYMKTPFGKEQLILSPTDLGAAFRGSGLHGRGLNYYKSGEFFKKALFADSIIYPRVMAFIPYSARTATFSDLLWMAEKIVSLSQTDIEKAVDKSHLPDFAKALLFYKLRSRQLFIANLFNLKEMIDRPLEVGKIIYDFNLKITSSAQVESVSRRYQIPFSLIMQFKEAEGLLHRDINDVIMKNAKIKTNSFLYRILKRYAYPDGF